MSNLDEFIEMNKSLVAFMKRTLTSGLKDWKSYSDVEITRNAVIASILQGVKLDIDSNICTTISNRSKNYERIYNRIYSIAIDDISKSLKHYQRECNMDLILRGQISIYDLISAQMKSIKESADVYTNITAHHQRLQESIEKQNTLVDTTSCGQGDMMNAVSSKDLLSSSNVSEHSFVAYASAAKAMGDRTWVHEANRYMYDLGIHFYLNGGARKFYKRNLKRNAAGLDMNTKASSLLNEDSKSIPAADMKLADDLSSNLLCRSDGTRNKIKLLDVGSCYNPLAKFDAESPTGCFYDVTACDLYPANVDEVFQCDFLQLKVGPKDGGVITKTFDDEGQKDTTNTKMRPISLVQLPRNSFDMVTMSLVLCYLPSPSQRMEMIKKARALLRNPSPNPEMPHDGGLLVIIEKESIFFHNAHINHKGGKGGTSAGKVKKSDVDLLEHWKQFITGCHCHVELGDLPDTSNSSTASSNSPTSLELIKQVGGFELAKYHCVTSETCAKNKHKYHMFAFRTVVVPDLNTVSGQSESMHTGMELIHEADYGSKRSGGLLKEVGLYIRQDYTPTHIDLAVTAQSGGATELESTAFTTKTSPESTSATENSISAHTPGVSLSNTSTTASMVISSSSTEADAMYVPVMGYDPLSPTNTKSIVAEFIMKHKDILKMLSGDKVKAYSTGCGQQLQDHISDMQSQQHADQPVVGIIGAGISGTILALSLKHFNIPFKLYEKDHSKESRKQGFGFTIQQASYVLKHLGLMDALIKHSVVSHSHTSYSAAGDCLGAYGVHVCSYDPMPTNGTCLLTYRPEFNHIKAKPGMSNMENSVNSNSNLDKTLSIESENTNPDSFLAKKRKRTLLYNQRKKSRVHSQVLSDDGGSESDDDHRDINSNGAAKQNYHIPRSVLRNLFIDHLGLGCEIHWNKELMGVRVVPKNGNEDMTECKGSNCELELHFQDGKKDRVSMLVGADGIHSHVYNLEHQLLDEKGNIDANVANINPVNSPASRNELNYLNLVAILGISPVCDEITYLPSTNQCAPVAFKPRSQHQWLDGNSKQCINPVTNATIKISNSRVFSMPYDAKQTMWQMSFLVESEEDAKNCVAAMSHAPLASDVESGSKMKDLALQITEDWHSPIVNIIQNTPNDLISGYVLYDRDVPQDIAGAKYAPIALIGDAAHPMSPFKGQGANQAIIDAWDLANSIRNLDMFKHLNGDSDSTDIIPMYENLSNFRAQMNDRVRPKVMKSRSAAIKLHSQDALSRGNITRAAVAESRK